MPVDYDHSVSEARHLIHEADKDHDGKLTRDEIIDKYDVFVGSQATDYGEALTRHDEFWSGEEKLRCHLSAVPVLCRV
ncbi:hypothetical protein MRX96_040394 [Rhipicephalus microplus]